MAMDDIRRVRAGLQQCRSPRIMKFLEALPPFPEPGGISHTLTNPGKSAECWHALIPLSAPFCKPLQHSPGQKIRTGTWYFEDFSSLSVFSSDGHQRVQTPAAKILTQFPGGTLGSAAGV